MFKKAHITILSVAMLLAGATQAQAQVTIGPRLGLNATKLNFDLEDDGPDTKYIFGPQVGVTLNAQFGNLALQPSILFSPKGTKIEVIEEGSATSNGETYSIRSEEKATIRLSYLEVPVNLVYSTNGADGGFQVFAGPYLGIGLSGNYKAENNYSASLNGQVVESMSGSADADIKFVGKASDGDEPEFRRLDFGLNAGLGYKAGSFQAQLGYGLGLSNLIPKSDDGDDSDNKIHNRGVQLSVAYFFGGK
ncbi:porin family protein [Hymenobacter sp. DG01]|uniref:porin family protein n=1 Tax=Hymenobacter sp. DG01 TaxID=2584940 RepID=UPI0011224879|nr:porin family protein [Hymenobacter sp. DG01]